jgi:hypothetical protein
MKEILYKQGEDEAFWYGNVLIDTFLSIVSSSDINHLFFLFFFFLSLIEQTLSESVSHHSDGLADIFRTPPLGKIGQQLVQLFRVVNTNFIF